MNKVLSFFKKDFLGVPFFATLIPLLVALAAILIGSSADWAISQSLVQANNPVAYFFETWGLLPIYCLLPMAGMMVFLSLEEKGGTKNALAWAVLVFSFYLGVHYLSDPLRWAFGYGSDPAFWRVVLAYLTAGVLMSWEMPLTYHFAKNAPKECLLQVGLLILCDCFLQVTVVGALKEIAARPRYRFLVSSANATGISFRPWWEWQPLSATVDGLKSFPSGHASFTTLLWTLPLLPAAFNHEKKSLSWILYAGVFLYSLFLCFTRIWNGAHFLSDVGFGTLIGLLCLSLCQVLIQKTAAKRKTL